LSIYVRIDIHLFIHIIVLLFAVVIPLEPGEEPETSPIEDDKSDRNRGDRGLSNGRATDGHNESSSEITELDDYSGAQVDALKQLLLTGNTCIYFIYMCACV
jgi:hypothetical protein